MSNNIKVVCRRVPSPSGSKYINRPFTLVVSGPKTRSRTGREGKLWSLLTKTWRQSIYGQRRGHQAQRKMDSSSIGYSLWAPRSMNYSIMVLKSEWLWYDACISFTYRGTQYCEWWVVDLLVVFYFCHSSLFRISAMTWTIHCTSSPTWFIDVMDGYNGTVFAYGQTGSGKTFTMMVCTLYISWTSN